jgi:hypothetical protein
MAAVTRGRSRNGIGLSRARLFLAEGRARTGRLSSPSSLWWPTSSGLRG